MFLLTNSHKLKFNQKVIALLFVFLPLLLISGPFLSDLAVSIVAIYFLLNFKEFKNHLKNQYIIIFALFYFSTLFNSFNFDYFFFSLKSFLFYFRFLFFILVISFLISKENKIINDLFKITLISIIIVCASGIIEFISIRLEYYTRMGNIQNLDEIITIKNTTSQRIAGIFGDEKILGSYLLKLFPIFLASYIYLNKDKKLNLKNLLFIFLVSLTIIVSMIISGDRAPIILFSFEIFLIFILVKQLRKIIFYIGTAFIIITSVAILNDPIVKERVVNTTLDNIKGEYNDNRTTFISKDYEGHFKAALIIFKKYPILGSGIKGFRNQCFKTEIINIDNVKCTSHPHNIVLQILSETGFLGFIIYLFIFYRVIKYIKYFYKEGNKNSLDNTNTSIIICLISFVIILWPLTTSGSFFNNYNTIFYCIPIVLCKFLINSKNNKPILK